MILISKVLLNCWLFVRNEVVTIIHILLLMSEMDNLLKLLFFHYLNTMSNDLFFQTIITIN